MRRSSPSAAGRAACLAGPLLVPLTILAGALALVEPASASPVLLARAARTISVKDEGRLHLVKSSGSLLIDEGTASGSIPGEALVRFIYNGSPSVNAQITIRGHSGSIQAHGSGETLEPGERQPELQRHPDDHRRQRPLRTRERHRHLYGVFYRRSYAMVVQTEGTLRY